MLSGDRMERRKRKFTSYSRQNAEDQGNCPGYYSVTPPYSAQIPAIPRADQLCYPVDKTGVVIIFYKVLHHRPQFQKNRGLASPDFLTMINWWRNLDQNALPSPFRPPRTQLIIWTDSSEKGWGAATSDGKEMSLRWETSMRNRHITELESLAVLNALQNFILPPHSTIRIKIGQCYSSCSGEQTWFPQVSSPSIHCNSTNGNMSNNTMPLDSTPHSRRSECMGGPTLQTSPKSVRMGR